MKQIIGNEYLEAKELVKQLEQNGWTSQDYKTQTYGSSEVFLSCEMTHSEYSEYILTVQHDKIELTAILEFDQSAKVLEIKNRSVGFCLAEIEKYLN